MSLHVLYDMYSKMNFTSETVITRAIPGGPAKSSPAESSLD